MKCPNGCCDILVEPTNNFIQKNIYYNRNKKKAGVFMYDPSLKKILLVQSNNNLWGPPKGTLNYNETVKDCALREVYEETGITVLPEKFTKAININNRATYFYMEKQVCHVQIPKNIYHNDATGISWINIHCLKDCIKNNIIILSKHCKIILNYFIK